VLVQTIASAVRGPHNTTFYDLVDAGPGLGSAFAPDQLSPEAANIIKAIENADGLIVSSPVYKGSYTGLFKHLFDFVAPDALIGKPVVIAATGGGYRHALVVEHQFRPLFGFFSALVAPTTVYASDDDFRDGALTTPDVVKRAAQAAEEFSALLPLSRQARSLQKVA
jgi:FMN reductase